MSLAESPSKYFIPHHSITKIDRNKLKLRVVFDGSAKTPNGSLNDHLMVGEKLQRDIRDILLNFRAHAIVFVTDIVKMYRNILIDPEDRSYQHIYWRSIPSEKLQVFELNTVVYGLTSSPFLALRVIRQLGIDEGQQYPLAAKCIERDVYVDDIVTGCNSSSEALELQLQLINLMKSGGFELSKWASNCKDILKSVANDISEDPVSLQNHEESSLKILGLEWKPATDSFSFKITSYEHGFTKRSILSTVARIYDPLGFLAPTVFYCKTFIQEIWKEGLDWDQPLTQLLESRWQIVLDQLNVLSSINIPRFVASNEQCQYQIVSFSDASTKGYCAVIYLRTIMADSIKVSLLISKTKLAPLKTISVPRLELCASFLLSKLYVSIQPFLSMLRGKLLPPVFFTDSTVVLGWLNMAPYLLKTFAANRVAEISKLTPISQWKHVISEHNPSDRGSRGLLPKDLVSDNLWWNGPHWIKLPQQEWPSSNYSNSDALPELKKVSTILVAVNPEEPPFIKWMKKFSSFFQLLRVIAVLKRGIHNHRTKPHVRRGLLEPADIEAAVHFCIKEVQRHHFLNNNDSNVGQFLKCFENLTPFLDKMEFGA
ncbi:hypothetical protein GE061_011461 [Apolygus lucorum]|uniref:Reverse transcriptase domain-containing protein n=1 Tax=Apolygus lucorum TaxID=248454 RepID=A0A8S9XYZ7_APOLU|nr:hypothetical protein GE061_011461 [Apolygus lucorum]